MPVCSELDSTWTAEYAVKRLLRAENGISHIQSSSAVLNLPPSSSHSLAWETQLQNRRKTKVERRQNRARRGNNQHAVRIPHQSWPDFFLLLSSLCPSWRRVQGCLTLFLWVFKNFSVLEATSLLSRARYRRRKCTTEAQRQSGAVRLGLPVSPAEWSESYRLSFQDCDSCLQSKLSLSALPE